MREPAQGADIGLCAGPLPGSESHRPDVVAA